MPEPRPKEEEQYGPPLPYDPRAKSEYDEGVPQPTRPGGPGTQRQWHIPSTTETIARDVGLGGAYDALRKGEVEVPHWLKALDPLQMVRDSTGWELPTSDEVQDRSRVEVDLRRQMRELDQKEGKWGGLPPMLESLPGDMLSALRLSPILPEELTGDADPLQDIANVYNRTRQQGPPRQGRTVEAAPAPEPEYIDWNGSVGVTR